MQYAIITENDESPWDDKTGVLYHFPKRYLKYLEPGNKVIYYKGRLTNRKFVNHRLTKDPPYFAVATIGFVFKDDKSSKNDYYARIRDFQRFPVAVLAKQNGKFLESIPESRKANFWYDGVRVLNESNYNNIIKFIGIDAGTGQSEYNDTQPGDSTLVTIVPGKEGRKKAYYTVRYERDQTLREQAIRIHGLSCMACGINFRETYGRRGEGYIHVHHKKPLHSLDEEVVINPKSNLDVVCPNCLSMIHRKKDEILTVEDLKVLMKKGKI
jgi:predicted HNH restriction endonuclease